MLLYIHLKSLVEINLFNRLNIISYTHFDGQSCLDMLTVNLHFKGSCWALRFTLIGCNTSKEITSYVISVTLINYETELVKLKVHSLMSSVSSFQSAQKTRCGNRHSFLSCAHSCRCQQEAHHGGHRGLASTHRNHPVQIVQDSGSDHRHWDQYVTDWTARGGHVCKDCCVHITSIKPRCWSW